MGGVVATLALVVAAKAGVTMATRHENISAVWPATGVAIWILITFGHRMWPVIAAVTWLVEVGWAEFPPVPAALIAAGATLEALAGAWLWRAVRQWWPGDPGAAAGCCVAALVAPLANASMGAAVVISQGGVAVSVPQLWFTWWMGDAFGALALWPVLRAAPELGRMVRNEIVVDAARAVFLLLAVAGVSWLAFSFVRWRAFLFSVFPVLLLAMGWFGAAGARFGALLIAGAGITAEFAGHGLFGGGTGHSNLLQLQVFLASVAVAALVLPLFRVRGSMLVPVTVLLVGWTLSGWLFATLERDGRRRQQEAFNQQVAEAEAVIRLRMTR